MANAFHIVVPFISCILLAQTCNSQNVYCHKYPPGVQQMIRGVDITTMDLMELEHIHQNGLKSPVLQLTCNNGKIWHCPDGEAYEEPDQIWTITTVPGGWMTSTANLLRTGNAVRKSFALNIGITGLISSWSFSNSLSYKKLTNAITNSSKYILDVSAVDTTKEIVFNSNLQLSLGEIAFQQSEKYLTGTYESNRIGYENFIDKFGTHYISSAKFGGMIQSFVEIDMEYADSKVGEEIKKQAKLSFQNSASIDRGIVDGSGEISGEFKKNSRVDVKYLGGNTNLLASDGLAAWQPTVAKEPWMLGVKLKPLSDLIDDENKKVNLNKAINQHVMRAHLDELLRLVFSGKWKLHEHNVILDNLEEKIKQQQRKTTLVVREVEDLSNEVNKELTEPTWYRLNTQLCFKWKPKTGGAETIICSKKGASNSQTINSASCRDQNIQWGIQAINTPEWFNKVSVCYKYDKCGILSACETCTGINSYVPKEGECPGMSKPGCKISWRLQTPDDAPIWLKVSKRCYSWNPDKSVEQCGPLKSSICARDKVWSPVYEVSDSGCRDVFSIMNNLAQMSMAILVIYFF